MVEGAWRVADESQNIGHTSRAEGRQQRNQWTLVLTAGLVSFVVMLEMNVVNVALPVIQKDLGSSQNVTQWVAVGYLLPVVALVLPSGRWLDQVGRRSAYALAVAGFAVASVVAGFSPTVGVLITARVVQGSFAALMFALMPALAAMAVRAEARGRAMSVLATMGPLGAVSGPPIGGILLDTVGWRPIFLLVAPICVGVIAVGLTTIPGGLPLRPPNRQWLVDAALLATAIGTLLCGLTLAAAHGPAWLGLAVLAVPTLMIWGRLPGSRPVLTLLRVPDMRVAQLAVIALSLGYAVMAFLVPFYLVRVVGASAAVTGLTVLAYPLAMAFTGPVGGFLADRWTPRRVAIIGATTVATSLLLIQPLSADWRPVDLAWRLALGGIGTGLFGGPVQAMAMNAAPRSLIATTAGTFQLARSLGFTLGPAIATMIWALSEYSPSGMRPALVVAFAAAGSGAGVLGLSLLAEVRQARSRRTAPDQITAGQEVLP